MKAKTVETLDYVYHGPVSNDNPSGRKSCTHTMDTAELKQPDIPYWKKKKNKRYLVHKETNTQQEDMIQENILTGQYFQTVYL